MSELKVNKITPRDGTTITLGDSGDTVSIPAGVTLSGDGSNLTNLPASGKEITESTTNPAIDTNPATGVGTLWLNKTTGNMWCLTDATAGANVWTNLGLGTANVTVGYDVDFLVVAGGGAGTTSGTSYMSAGGGGGGLRTSWPGGSGGGGDSEDKIQLRPSNVYTITVGGGGASHTEVGGNSSIVGTGVNIVSTGGGGGAVNPPTQLATSGGSGGGGLFADIANSTVPGSGTANQGYDGGVGGGPGSHPCGGGGGAAEVGHDSATHGNIGGGAGKEVNIDGNSYYWSGGGGGACHSPHTAGPGGIGGGGYGMGYQTSATGSAGGSAKNPAGIDGGANTGGGAGGSTWYYSPGSNGGSGCVILRVPTSEYPGVSSVTGNPDITTDGTDTILTYTGTGTYTA